MLDHVVIVGAGQAGVQLAATLREKGYQELITIAGDERHLPYSRPPLSKALLSGTADAADLDLRTAQYYDDHGIDVIPSLRIESIESDGARGVAVAESGRRLRFDRLAITTGAAPRRQVLNVSGGWML